MVTISSKVRGTLAPAGFLTAGSRRASALSDRHRLDRQRMGIFPGNDPCPEQRLWLPLVRRDPDRSTEPTGPLGRN